MSTTTGCDLNRIGINDNKLMLASQNQDSTMHITTTNMLDNIKRYNAGERDMAEHELTTVVPTLIQSGIFDLFPAEEWIEGNNAGRRFVGEKALQYMSVHNKEREKIFVFPRFFMI